MVAELNRIRFELLSSCLHSLFYRKTSVEISNMEVNFIGTSEENSKLEIWFTVFYYSESLEQFRTDTFKVNATYDENLQVRIEHRDFPRDLIDEKFYLVHWD